MPTSTPKKRTSTRSTARKATTRKRSSKSAPTNDQTEAATSNDAGQAARRLPSGLPEQLMIVLAAIAFGLVGLFVHILFVVSLVLMALLLGLLASEARGQRGRGIVAEVVNEAKVVIDDVKKPGTLTSDTSTDDSPASETAS